LLLAKEMNGHFAWHQAALGGSLEALKSIWIWAKELELNTDELLITETGNGCTAFQLAAENDHVETLNKLRSGLDRKLNPNEVRNNLVLSKDSDG